MNPVANKETNKNSSFHSNTILLTLPNVSLGENVESGVGRERNGSTITRTFAGGEMAITDAKQLKGELESVSDADEEEFFSHQHLTSKERLSPGLQDVYKLLMQLPSFSHTSWDGFSTTSGRSGQKATFLAANKSKNCQKGKMRKHAFITGKVNKHHTNLAYFSGTDSVAEQQPQEDVGSESMSNKRPNREMVKMHSINLYQSILPSNLFTRRKT